MMGRRSKVQTQADKQGLICHDNLPTITMVIKSTMVIKRFLLDD